MTSMPTGDPYCWGWCGEEVDSRLMNEKFIIIVLVGSIIIAGLKEGQHVDHLPETNHEVPTSLIVSYAQNGTITGSFCSS